MEPGGGPIVPPDSVARSRAVADEWRQGDAYRAVEAAFADVAMEADALAAAARALFADLGWLDGLLAPLIAALRADPWFEPPLKVNRAGLRSGAILFERPGVAVSLSVMPAEMLQGRMCNGNMLGPAGGYPLYSGRRRIAGALGDGAFTGAACRKRHRTLPPARRPDARRRRYRAA